MSTYVFFGYTSGRYPKKQCPTNSTLNGVSKNIRFKSLNCNWLASVCVNRNWSSFSNNSKLLVPIIINTCFINLNEKEKFIRPEMLKRFEKDFNLSESVISKFVYKIIPNHSELTRKKCWIILDANGIKMNPIRNFCQGDFF